MKTKKIETLNDLFLEELGGLYNAENQLIEALPRITEAINSQELRTIIEDQLEKTKMQANRLKVIFKELKTEPDHVVCKGMMGLIQEGQQLVRKSAKCPARDAAIIGTAQTVE
ncbi:MAG: DUF892 family protein, partial [Candidatus Omnitrophica bacterium]|nr:DUF892 family protein [Candidatus Omnitrophota bacterium]